MFAVIGDGCDNATAAERLGMEATTIRSVREELHRKLRVQHKGELVRLALEQGYVCIGAHGIFRPGLIQLLAARGCRRPRPGRAEHPGNPGDLSGVTSKNRERGVTAPSEYIPDRLPTNFGNPEASHMMGG